MFLYLFFLIVLLYLTTKRVHYFAYGSNMNSSILKQRHITPLSRMPAICHGYHLAFTATGYLDNPSFASIESGGTCHGVLYEITYLDFIRLCFYEGVPLEYTVREITVQTYSGIEQRTLTFQAVHYGEKDIPSKHYLDIIINGARENGLDENYIQSII